MYVEYEDDLSAKRNKELLKKELARPKQKPDALRELIKRTFKTKRELVSNNTRPELIVLEYPHLRWTKSVCCGLSKGVITLSVLLIKYR